nr:MAG TPA_asm: abortive infection protein [Caudoviricetes sp.]
MKEDYKFLLILGNGFDLDLGLKTKYTDFMKSAYFQSYIDYNGNREGIGLSFSREINLFEYLSKQCELCNWIDIEKELADLASSKDASGYGDESLNEASELEERTFKLLHTALCDYLNAIDYSCIRKDSKALDVFKIIAKYSSVEILSYNYTNLYKLESYVGVINSKIDYIHGHINDRSIILGIQDEIDIDDSYCFMIKSFSPHYKSHNVRAKLLNADEIIFFGHSLGSTDYHYFQDLFKRQANAETANPNLILRIFTFDESARRDILIQLRRMNNNRTDMLYDLCDFGVYRAGVSDDNDKIYTYLEQLEMRLENYYGIKYTL